MHVAAGQMLTLQHDAVINGVGRNLLWMIDLFAK
jgi:hypothetical protein